MPKLLSFLGGGFFASPSILGRPGPRFAGVLSQYYKGLLAVGGRDAESAGVAGSSLPIDVTMQATRTWGSPECIA